VRRVFIPLPQRLSAEDSWYGVKVRGDQNADGSWQPCLEFESRRVRVETCPKMTLLTVDELKEWARHLDAPFLLNALSEASKGPIRRPRRRRTDV
jgi:hypothetical protein